MANDAWLVDERWLKAYPIASTLSIGRGPENAVILRDPAVSRLHATITGDGDGYLLRSFGTSGTVLNGLPAERECVLHEGDRIEIASTTLRFTCLEPDDETIVLPRDHVVSLDRLAAATSAHPAPGWPTRPRRRPGLRTLALALAFLAGSLLIFVALK